MDREDNIRTARERLRKARDSYHQKMNVLGKADQESDAVLLRKIAAMQGFVDAMTEYLPYQATLIDVLEKRG